MDRWKRSLPVLEECRVCVRTCESEYVSIRSHHQIDIKMEFTIAYRHVCRSEYTGGDGLKVALPQKSRLISISFGSLRQFFQNDFLSSVRRRTPTDEPISADPNNSKLQLWRTYQIGHQFLMQIFAFLKAIPAGRISCLRSCFLEISRIAEQDSGVRFRIFHVALKKLRLLGCDNCWIVRFHLADRIRRTQTSGSVWTRKSSEIEIIEANFIQ